MFCVIQEVQTKRPDKNGHPKELLSKFMNISINGADCGHYYYTYSSERFERPLKPSYRKVYIRRIGRMESRRSGST